MKRVINFFKDRLAIIGVGFLVIVIGLISPRVVRDSILSLAFEEAA